MRVALIQPETGNIVHPPVNLGYLSAFIRQNGFECRVFDLQIVEQRKTYEQDIKDFKPGIFGVTTMTPQLPASVAFISQAKAWFGSDLLSVMGGVHPTVLPEQTLIDYADIDVLVLGEGELTLLELCQTLENGGGWKSTPGIAFRDPDTGNPIIRKRKDPPDLDYLPPPHTEYDFEYYLTTGQFIPHGLGFGALIGSRGCPFPCTFCAANRYGGMHRTRSPARIIEEIQYMLAKGARGVYFLDSTFMVNRQWVLDLCNLLKPLGVSWCVDGRVDLVDEKLLRAMSEAGCYALFYGIESGSQRILDYYRKKTTVEQNKKILRLTRETGIRTTASFILGAPIETAHDLEKTVKFIEETTPSYYAAGILSPMPGSKIYEDLLAQGHSFDFDSLTRDHASMGTSELSMEQLESVLQYLKEIRPDICESWIELNPHS